MTFWPFWKKRTMYEVAPRAAGQVKTREGTKVEDVLAGDRLLFAGPVLLASGTLRAGEALLTDGARVTCGLFLRGALGRTGRADEDALGSAARTALLLAEAEEAFRAGTAGDTGSTCSASRACPGSAAPREYIPATKPAAPAARATSTTATAVARDSLRLGGASTSTRGKPRTRGATSATDSTATQSAGEIGAPRSSRAQTS